MGWLTKTKSPSFEVAKWELPPVPSGEPCSMEGVMKGRVTLHITKKMDMRPGDTLVFDFDMVIHDDSGLGYRGEWIKS